ncbi:DEAD/DEAH box helicase [Streptomyces sp. NPDC048523]|uniref:DEAD/DEAH box helicase n=1 Tax=Streptomyces sp. NPDC048523 TaxID=3365567 RepID=UPI00371B384C
MTLPVALSGSDVIGQAKTGTGKTLGFGLPLLERVTVPADVEAGRAKPEDLTDAPQALVVVPTRELCTQVTNDLQTAGKVRNVRVLAIYGGRAYEPQVEALKKGVDVVIGTPGRLLDLAGQKKLNLGHIKALVLDEADEMLDLGFLPDVEKIINLLPARRQTMLFSATMPGAVISLARRYMSQPTHINATSPDDAGRTVANTKQHVYRAHNMDKPEMVARILQADGRGLVMVFCRTKRTAADLADQLKQRGFAAGAVHGDLGQGAREQALRAFRNGKVDVLVCTDVAARGIDVEGVTHVINYQCPEEEKTYLHRIGRTGRAGAKGIAVTLVDWDDIPRWNLINKALELKFNDPPETYSTSPHFYEELNIPAGTKGVLPRADRTRAGLDAEELEDLGETGGRGARGRGDRDRGDRDRGRGRGGRDESRSADREHADRERGDRTPRRRRRTRSGTPLEAGAPAEAVAPEAVAPSETTAVEDATTTRTPRRRRRTRGAASDSAPATATTATTAAVAVEPAVSEAAESAVTTAEGPSLDTEAPAKPRRRRTRKSAEAPAVVETVVETPPVTEAAPVAETAPVEAPATKPRRTRKTAAASAPAEAAVDTAEAAETKPRRTRKTAAAAPAAEAAVDTAEGTVTKPRRTRKTTAAPAETEAVTDTAEVKPRRTRKTATAATKPAETAVDTAEAAEAKPRRTRKAATAAPAAEAAVDTAEGTVTKPRRTRKAAEPAVTAEIPAQTVPETSEAAEVAKPRRTRKTASTAKAAEAAVDTAEGTVTKPRRTRKATAAPAETAADTAETAEAKPRRTRKTAATAEVVTDAADAKPRRRTTRKAAEPVVSADIPAQADQEPKAAAPRRRTRKTAAAEPADS